MVAMFLERVNNLLFKFLVQNGVYISLQSILHLRNTIVTLKQAKHTPQKWRSLDGRLFLFFLNIGAFSFYAEIVFWIYLSFKILLAILLNYSMQYWMAIVT